MTLKLHIPQDIEAKALSLLPFGATLNTYLLALMRKGLGLDQEAIVEAPRRPAKRSSAPGATSTIKKSATPVSDATLLELGISPGGIATNPFGDD